VPPEERCGAQAEPRHSLLRSRAKRKHGSWVCMSVLETPWKHLPRFCRSTAVVTKEAPPSRARHKRAHLFGSRPPRRCGEAGVSSSKRPPGAAAAAAEFRVRFGVCTNGRQQERRSLLHWEARPHSKGQVGNAVRVVVRGGRQRDRPRPTHVCDPSATQVRIDRCARAVGCGTLLR